MSEVFLLPRCYQWVLVPGKALGPDGGLHNYTVMSLSGSSQTLAAVVGPKEDRRRETTTGSSRKKVVKKGEVPKLVRLMCWGEGEGTGALWQTQFPLSR